MISLNRRFWNRGEQDSILAALNINKKDYVFANNIIYSDTELSRVTR
jgi:hypothetical protein